MTATAARPTAPPAALPRQRRWLLLGPALLLAAVGVLLLAVPPSKPPPSVVVRVPGHPTGLVATGGQVWVAAQRSGAVWVLDAKSARPAGRPVRTGGAPARLAVGAGGVWAADVSRGALVPVQRDPTRVFAPVQIGADASDVALSAGAVWVASSAEDSVRALEPGGAVRKLPIGDAPVALDADERRVAAAESGSGSVAVIDAARRRLIGRVRVGGEPADVAIAGESAWVADAARGRVVRVDLRMGRMDGRGIAVGRRPVALAAAGNDVYVLCTGDRTLVHLDGRRGAVSSRRRVGGDPAAVAVDSRYVWVADAGDDTVTRFAR